MPLESELAAATAVAAKAGMGIVTPRVLNLGKHTTLTLAPFPIVARLRSGSAPELSHRSLARELIVARHLASRGAPTTRPTTEVGAGPYLESGCVITLWELVDGRAASIEADASMAAATLRQVHEALEGIALDLPSFTAAIDSCEIILADAAEAPKLTRSDRLFLQRLYGALRRELDALGCACGPIHGDAHPGNVVMTASGAVWMDLESVCIGPREWDVVNLPAGSWREFERVDRELMRLLSDLRQLCVAVWCWADLDRSKAMAEAATHHLAELKARFA